MRLTDHFTWGEVIDSEIADRWDLDNTPPAAMAPVIRHTAARMEVVRWLLRDQPIKVLSWYRCPEVNEKAGSSENSQHLMGEAVDFVCPTFGRGLVLDICKHLRDNAAHLQYDQLIFEFRWVHISFTQRRKPRLEVLTVQPGQRKGVYGLPSK